MQRPLPEVLASQEEMLRHRGTPKPGFNTSAIATAFESHLREVDAWLGSKSYLKILRIPYHDVLHDAEDIGRQLVQFLEIGLNVEAMTRQVDATLYRNRTR